MNKFKIVTFYEFTKINELNELKVKLNNYLSLNRIKGTILLSYEGINGTISGSVKSIDGFMELLKTEGINNINPKFSFSEFLWSPVVLSKSPPLLKTTTKNSVL